MSTLPTINAIECQFIRLELSELKTRVEVLTRPGFSGVGAMDLGKNDSRWSAVAVKYGLKDDIDDWFASIEALQGTTVTIVDDWEVERDDLFLVQVSPRNKRPALIPGNENIDTRGELRLEGIVRNIE